MKTEYEGRFLEINSKEIVNKLENLNAKYIGSFNQQRYVYDMKPKETSRWIRLRTNGVKSTLTIKDVKTKTISGTKELEIEVSDFDKTHAILKELGYIEKGFQENKRIRYMLNDIEIDIDSWPLIPTYLEIEGSSEKDVIDAAIKLGLNPKDICTLDVQSIYQQYGIDLDKTYYLNFEGEDKNEKI